MRASSGPSVGLLLLLAYPYAGVEGSSNEVGLPILGVAKGLLDTRGVGEEGEVDLGLSPSCVALRLGANESFPPLSSSPPLRPVAPLACVPKLVLLVGDSSSRSLIAPFRRLDRRCVPSFQSLLAFIPTSPRREFRCEVEERLESRSAFRLCRSASSQRLRVCIQPKQ
jgi:hypothetical protein